MQIQNNVHYKIQSKTYLKRQTYQQQKGGQIKAFVHVAGLIKTRFKSVSRFFLFFPIFSDFSFLPDLKKKKKKSRFFFFFFLPFFFFFPIVSWFSRFFPSYFLYSSLFCPIFFPIFLLERGNVVRCHFFSPRILFFFFYSRGAWLRGKQKKLFFFSAHYHPWCSSKRMMYADYKILTKFFFIWHIQWRYNQ